MTLSEVKDPSAIDPKEFKKEIEKESIGNLRMRRDSLQKFFRETDRRPLELVEEKIERKTKITSLLQILNEEITKKEKALAIETQKIQEKNRQDTAKLILPDLRICHTSQVDHLIKGILSIDVLVWEKISDVEFDVTMRTGNKKRFNLIKDLSDSQWRTLIGHALTPVYVVLEPQGIYRKGVLQSLWYDGADYNRAKGDVLKPRTTLAIMRV